MAMNEYTAGTWSSISQHGQDLCFVTGVSKCQVKDVKTGVGPVNCDAGLTMELVSTSLSPYHEAMGESLLPSRAIP